MNLEFIPDMVLELILGMVRNFADSQSDVSTVSLKQRELNAFDAYGGLEKTN